MDPVTTIGHLLKITIFHTLSLSQVLVRSAYGKLCSVHDDFRPDPDTAELFHPGDDCRCAVEKVFKVFEGNVRRPFNPKIGRCQSTRDLEKAVLAIAALGIAYETSRQMSPTRYWSVCW
jgi:hypothetical protein